MAESAVRSAYIDPAVGTEFFLSREELVTVIAPQKSSDAVTSNWISLVLPYLAVIICCLAIVSNSPKNFPPIGNLLVTIGAVCALVGCLHAAWAFFYRKPILRDLILMQVVLSFGAYSWVKYAVHATIPTFVFLPLWFSLLAIIAYGTSQLEDEKWVNKLVSGSATFGSILCLLQLVAMVPLIAADYGKISQLVPTVEDSEVAALDASDRPDIYYIILDAYGREDVLADLYSYDNSPFINALEQRGFAVGDNSRSNYFFTELSLASSLNMSYLHELGMDRFSTGMATKELITKGRVVQLLREIGYETVALPTGKSTTECDNFDRYLPADWAMDNYQTGLFHITPLPDLLQPFDKWVWTSADGYRSRVTSTLDSLENVPTENDQPKFVFSHLLSPHPPFVFDKDGNPRAVYGRNLLDDGNGFTMLYQDGRSVYIDGYRQQVQHLNQRLLGIVDSIQERSGDNAVIILQADHGPRLWATEQEAPKDLSETFGILNAIYVPKKYGKFTPPVSPVNTFRALFNHCFAASYELKDNRSYAESSRYVFVDVTKRIAGADQVATSKND